MIWLLSVATFLATVAIVLILSLLFSYKEKIAQALKEARSEARILATVSLELSNPDGAFASEVVSTENVSPRGARILSTKSFPRKCRVLVQLPAGQQSPARIAYCDEMPGKLFAVGLHFSSRVALWNIEPSAAGLSVGPYRK